MKDLRKLGFVLLWMARPLQLGAIAAVYVLGKTLAIFQGASIDALAFGAGLLALLFTSASVHYANEYTDVETDARAVRTPFSGGSGALQRTGLPRRMALQAAWIAAALGALSALLGWATGVLPPVSLVLLTLGGFLGWMYSVGPLKLAWRGLGELDNAFLGGILLPLYGFAVQTGRIDWRLPVGLAPFAALVFVNLLATTWSDLEADASVGKLTLAARWPARRLRLMYALVAGAAFLGLPFLTGWGLPASVVLASFLALPVTLWGYRRFTRSRSPFPSVAAMGSFLILQLAAWWTETGICTL